MSINKNNVLVAIDDQNLREKITHILREYGDYQVMPRTISKAKEDMSGDYSHIDAIVIGQSMESTSSEDDQMTTLIKKIKKDGIPTLLYKEELGETYGFISFIGPVNEENIPVLIASLEGVITPLTFPSASFLYRSQRNDVTESPTTLGNANNYGLVDGTLKRARRYFQRQPNPKSD